MIPVTKSFIPPLQEYESYVARAFENGWLTNRGQLVLELEEKLKDYLQIPNMLITNNGTIPLQIALKLLGGGGEIITTPFSYVATTSSIVWENCTPVFADIDPDHFTIDPEKIEAEITENTTAILATHVFGNPCDVEKINAISEKYQLPVIYDGAHSFGTRYLGKSVFEFGTISTSSFHATKLFHTGEGGCIVVNDPQLQDKVYYSHNFGHNGPLAFHGLGINGKISELQAAMGLAVLPHISEIIEARKKAVEQYRSQLNNTSLKFMQLREGLEWNYSYFPVIFPTVEQLLDTEKKMQEADIFPRRYFYPSLNTLPYLTRKQKMPVSEQIANTVMCLPLYHSITEDEITRITQIIQESLR